MSLSRFHKQSDGIICPNNYRVYVSFCGKNRTPSSNNANLCNWIECYNPSNNSWHTVTSIPGLIENQVLKGFAMVSVGESFIYVIGGRICHNKDINHDDDSYFTYDIDLEVIPNVLRYDVRKDVWYKCAPMKMARCDFACTVSKNKIYVAGGQSTFGCGKGISSAEVYDPVLDEWKSLPNMSTLRYKCVGVTWQGKIYVVGGFAERGDNDSPGPFTMERSSAEVYDIEHKKWDLKARMWELDVPPNQIVTINGKLFSSGDCLNAWKGHVESYNGKLKMWDMVRGSRLDTLSSSSSMQQRLYYLTMAPIGSNLYFLAGYRKVDQEEEGGDDDIISRIKTEVYVFDTCENGDGWKSFEPIEEQGEKELCCHCCVLIKQD